MAAPMQFRPDAENPQPVVAQPIATAHPNNTHPCAGCCPAACFERTTQLRMTFISGIVAFVGFILWVAFANAEIVAMAVLGFFIMFIAAIVSIVGCTLYCCSDHPQDQGDLGMVGVVQTPAQPQVLIAQPQMVTTPQIPVGEVVYPQSHAQHAQPVESPPEYVHEVEAPEASSTQKLP